MWELAALTIVFAFLWLVLACGWLVLAYYTQRMRKEILSEVATLLEAELEHLDLSLRGQKGAEVREENKERRQMALNEGREMLAHGDLKNPFSLLPAVRSLAQKYPREAEGVARTLIREFGIPKQFEGAILQEIGKAVMQPQQQQQSEEGF